jgi:hypothetical protein
VPPALLRALVALLVALTGAALLAAPASARDEQDAVAGPVVLVGAAGLRWDDVDPRATPALDGLLGSAAVGDISIRSVRTTACPIDGWLALSAGRRAADAPRTAEPLCRTPGEPARQGRTAVLENFATYAETARDGSFGAVPGTLGDLLREERVSVTAVGPGAAIAAVGTDGKVVGDYEALPRDPQALGDLLEPRLLRDDLLLVDAGTVRDPDDLGDKDPDRLAGDRADQVARIDARVGAVLDVVPDGATVIVVSLADSGRTPHLQLVAATGPAPGGEEYDAALLGSRSTRQDGLVQATDLMPTVLGLVGVEAPGGLPGAVIAPQPGDTTAAERRQKVSDLSEAAITVQPLVVWFFNGLVIAQILLYGAAALALRNNLGGRDGRRRVLGVLRRVAVVFASVPVATFLANLVPWWRSDQDLLAVVGVVFGWVLVIATVALAGPWRDRRLGPLGVVSGITAGVLALDVLTGSQLQTSSLMGQQPVVAGRFYGLGNVQFALFATGALMLATSLADATLRAGRRRLALAVVVVVGVLAVVIDGTPGIGSDFGGPPAMIPAFTLLALLVAGVQVTWRRVVLIGLGTALVVVLLSVADWLRPAADRTHFGRFVETVIDGGALVVVQRKALQNWEILTGSYLTLLVPFGAVFVGLVLMRPSAWGAPALQRTYEASPTLRHGLGALLVMLFIGFAVNDSGTVVPAIGATLVIPLLIAASVRTLELAQDVHAPAGAGAPPEPPPEPVRRAGASAPAG